MIDPHVHFRDEKWAYKETIAHGLELAESQGVEKVFDMPNLPKPIIREKDLVERLKLVPEDKREMYYLYLGVTESKEQLTEAVKLYDRYPEVIGLKMFAGKSVGDLEIIEESKQKEVYMLLSILGFTGVLAVHCEKESYMQNDLWDPKNPITHAYARPKKAEIESVRDQIDYAKQSEFSGILHIPHISCPESVELVDKARKEIKITCGVTPHHIMWDTQMMSKPNGLIYKMNPPLRIYLDKVELQKQLKKEMIDWIETDHAPHAIGEKLFPPYLSGYPSLYLYSKFVTDFLPNIVELNKEQIRKLTYDNIVNTFKNKLD